MNIRGRTIAGNTKRFGIKAIPRLNVRAVLRIKAYAIRIIPTIAHITKTLPILSFTMDIDLTTLFTGFKPSITTAKGANVNATARAVRYIEDITIRIGFFQNRTIGIVEIATMNTMASIEEGF